MLVWGADLGIRSLHLVGFDQLTNRYQTHSVVVPKMSSRSAELRELTNAAIELVGNDRIFAEEPPLAGSRNIRTALALSQVAGAVLSRVGAVVYLVPVSAWKKQVVGKGNATKDEVADWVKHHHHTLFEMCEGDQNKLDAVCLMLYGTQTLHLAGV